MRLHFCTAQADPDLARAVLLSFHGDPGVREEVATTTAELLAEADEELKVEEQEEEKEKEKTARLEEKAAKGCAAEVQGGGGAVHTHVCVRGGGDPRPCPQHAVEPQ